MGTRDRVMGDAMFLGPMENPLEGKLGSSNLNQMAKMGDFEMESSRFSQHSSIAGGDGDNFGHNETSYATMYRVKGLMQMTAGAKKEVIDVINDELIDIQKIRFNDRL